MSPHVQRLERLLGRLLAAGVALSTALLLVGLAVSFWKGSTGLAAGFLHAGLLVLMATPMVRVLVSFAEYVRQRDWFFALVTFAVLGELALTVVVAFRSR